MKRFVCILKVATVFLCFESGLRPEAKTPERPPNIVFFLVDDLGWRDVGCYGSTFYETPHIDRLATEGVRFTDAYAACHVCSNQIKGRLRLPDAEQISLAEIGQRLGRKAPE